MSVLYNESDRQLLGRKAEFVERIDEALKPWQHWFPRAQRRYTAMRWWPIGFYNHQWPDGQCNLYLHNLEPGFVTKAQQASCLRWLPYRKFADGGNMNGAQFWHRGHLHDIYGGKAHVRLELSGVRFDLTIQPMRVVYVLETAHHVRVFQGRTKVVLTNVPRARSSI